MSMSEELFDHLEAWRLAGKNEEERRWSVRSFYKGHVFCELTWLVGDYRAVVRQIMPTGEEAVRLALLDFDEWERDEQDYEMLEAKPGGESP